MISRTVDRWTPELTTQERDYYSLNKKVYDVFAPYYDILVRPISGMRRKIARVISLDPGAKVLDVATGTGAQAFAFAERAGEVVGVDLNDAMLRIARRHNRFPSVTFRWADATRLPFSDHSFDIACISFALHEMPSSVRSRVLREMARVTRPGGSVVVVDYALPRHRLLRALAFRAVKLYERDHYAEFVHGDLGRMLEDEGIRVRWRAPLFAGVVTAVEGVPHLLADNKTHQP
jgi:demethylmenaquinone methyltransferase/2-methoxy-6-polyprenyl-1,4-benzoquinol methylase